VSPEDPSLKADSRDAVPDFLGRFKAKVRKDGMVFVRRPENVNTLAFFGFLTYQAEDCIMRITDRDYIGGPSPNHDKSPGEVWEFAIQIQDLMVYVKLKLDQESAKCISFHRPRDPLTFPFK
jgi:hypothetical protein